MLSGERYIQHRVKAYVAWFLLLESAIMGIFLSLDLIVFFVFWELMLVPMYFLIQGWGSGRKEFAAMKFFIYTAAGSAFLLAATIALGFLHQADTGHLTFDYRILAQWNGLTGTHPAPVLPRVHGRLRHQGAPVPVPHLVAGSSTPKHRPRARSCWPA